VKKITIILFSILFNTLFAQDTLNKSADSLALRKKQILLVYQIGTSNRVYCQGTGHYYDWGNQGGLVGFRYGISGYNDLGITYGELVEYIQVDPKALKILKRARVFSTISLCSLGGIAIGGGILVFVNQMSIVPLSVGIAGTSLLIGITTKILARHGLKKSIKTYNKNLGLGNIYKCFLPPV